jgi:hypothetical protein
MKMFPEAAIAAMASGEAIVQGALAIYCNPMVFVWGGDGPLTLGEDSYVGLGARAFAQLTGGAIGGGEQGIEVGLSGIDPETMALFDASEVASAPFALWKLIFDGSGTQMLDARVWKRGRVDAAPLEDVIGATSTIRLGLETAARGLGRATGRMRSDADQRLTDPNDGFFKHCAYAGTKRIYFGGKPSSAAQATNG